MPTDSRTTLLAVVCCVLALTGAVGYLATIPTATDADAGDADVSRSPAVTTDPPPTADGLDAVHEAGVTGENVSVGVVDVTGFDTGHPAVASRVAETRAFGTETTVRNEGRNRHGTAAAAVVARAAPDADLYLATFDGSEGYEEAVGWLVERDVDVIVAPVSFYGRSGDGESAEARAATRAVEAGVVFVAPAGNVAEGHLRARYATVDDGRLRYRDGTVRNRLRNGGRRVTVWLSWDRTHRYQDYTAELYRTGPTGSRLVARSQPYRGDGVPNERIVARLRPGNYHVVVAGPANATGARLELVSPTHDLEWRRSAGSIVAPAAGHGVLSVGAYDPDRERVEPFSSRGPTPDGRLGVDVVAADRRRVAGRETPFVGSSAAAPYVGGVAALVLDVDPDSTPRRVEQRIERAAVDVARPGPDPVAGHGLIRPRRAVGVATDRPTVEQRANRTRDGGAPDPRVGRPDGSIQTAV